MIRVCLFATCVAVSLMSVGCCGPMGPGCSIPMGCSDCDGCGTDGVPNGPLDGLRRMKRSIVCGSGCGETYVGEWISTPPDAQDPCCGDQWVGGATPCQPFCWTPGTLLGGLYGSRFCSGAESSADCGCGDSSCDGCEYSEHQAGAPAQDCGCAACKTQGSSIGSRMMVGEVPASDRMTRSASARNMDARIQGIRR